MRKIGQSGLMVGVILTAMTAGILVFAVNGRAGPAVSEANAVPIPDRPDWNWDVAPILSQNCFSCHGQATQKANLRLDIQKSAYDPLPSDSKKRAVVPGSLDKSELYKRITTSDADEMMPPKDSHKTLSPRDVAVIKRWIQQGAKYKPHWSYIEPELVKPQKTEWDKQAVNQIDHYVYAKLATEGLSPSREADRETLINRVYLDLTGLPPSLAEVDAFVASKDPNAYEKIVDKLLASTEYAERQTNIWMDVARYADTRGGLNDNDRPITYPYRDWLITAFQRNIPYDQFATWQLAGDQLPNATREQLLASAFLKAGRQDSEGGSIDEEFRMNYVEERTELIGKDFLGLTVGCAKCHDHKYDVISNADYYSLSGFFNQMDERGGGSFSRGTPMGAALEWPTPLQAKNLAAAQAATAAKQKAYEQALHAAQARNAAQLANLPANRRGAFLQASIQADTQAYYPLDNGYKGDFSALYLEPQILGLGALDRGIKDKFPGKDRAILTAMLQKQIAADVKAGKPIPTVAPADQSRGKPGASPIMKAGAKPGEAKLIKANLPHGAPAMGPDPAKPTKPAEKPRPLSAFGKRPTIVNDMNAMKADPGLPRLASREIDWALEEIVAYGYLDARLGDPQRISRRELPTWTKPDALLWTDSGLPNGKKGFLSSVKFVPGHKGQGIELHDSVFSMDMGVGQFERTQPYTLDFWMKLPAKKVYFDNTRPRGPSATILYNNGGIESVGYELSMDNNKLAYSIVHSAPTDMLLISTKQDVPTGRWVHITSTYDGSSKAAGMHLYFDGKEAEVETEHDHLTRSAIPRGVNSEFGSYFGLSAGINFNRPELVDGAIDEVRVVTRALTPLEVSYLQDPNSVQGVAADKARNDMALAKAEQDPAVHKAFDELTAARLAEQKVESPISRIMVSGDQLVPRKTYLLDRGVYNVYRQEVQPQAPSRVFPWSDKLPRNRLGLAKWLFDPKNPLTARVYVNRMWQGHFGNGIVQTVDDFGMQGTNPTHPQLLDYLAIEFQRSGWDMKHMHKLMVMSATYRQSSNLSPDNREKDPRNFLLERGPRFRMPAELVRDNALSIAGLLDKKVGGDSVFPYAPDAIWDGAAQGLVIYPTLVPDNQMHRRSMYTYVKRNVPVADLVPFDMPDRRDAQVIRPISNTPLQALVMLNDTQFVEAYRKLAERAIRSSPNPDQQLTNLWRLAVRRHPDAQELTTIRHFRDAQTAEMQAAPDKAKKLLAIGVAPADASLDQAQVAAMTVVAASVLNTPDAYTQR